MNILSFTHSLKLSVQPRYSSLRMLNTHPQVVPNQYEFFFLGGGYYGIIYRYSHRPKILFLGELSF